MSSQEKKPIYKKWWFWVIIVVVIVGVGGAAGSSNNKQQDQSSNPSSAAKVEDTPDDKLVDLKVGDSVIIRGATITVNSIKDGTPALAGTAPTYEVNVTYKNNTGKSLSITPYDWTTVLHSGSDKAHVGGDTSFHLDNIGDGEEWTGNVTLWADDTTEKIKFESSSLNLGQDNNKSATWIIEKE